MVGGTFPQTSMQAGPHLPTGARETRTRQPHERKPAFPGLIKTYLCFIGLKLSGLDGAGHILALGRTLAFLVKRKWAGGVILQCCDGRYQGSTYPQALNVSRDGAAAL